MSLLDELRDYSEGEEPVDAADAALIEGALVGAELAPPPAVHPAVVVTGAVVVAAVAAALLWPSQDEPRSAPSAPAVLEQEPVAPPQTAPPRPESPQPTKPEVEPPPPDTSSEAPPQHSDAVAEPARPPAKRASLNELLERAQASRAAGEHSEAAQIYRRAVRSYPKVPAARRALVTLAELELTQLGRPGAALKTFDRYLEQGKDPVLVQEAGYGRLRALRKLGREDAEAKAISSFLAAHPKSPYRKALEERQKKLVTPSAPAGLNPSDD